MPRVRGVLPWSNMDVLIINSYAGSLTLGASQAGARIIGSYEDAGFGLPIQQANFPRLTFIAEEKDWPAQPLKDVVVLAHPPCSAFSNQSPKHARGLETAAFKRTVKVLTYAMSNKAAAIAVESVTGTMVGAWDVHERFAAKYDYHVYRVLLNSCLFGVPQWRERFWCLFVRKGAAPPLLQMRINPRLVRLAEALKGADGPTLPYLDEQWTHVLKRLSEEARLTPSQIAQLTQDVPKMPGRGLSTVVQKLFFPQQDPRSVCRAYVTKFRSTEPYYLDPNGLAPALLGVSHWIWRGQPLSIIGYKRAMGFPDNYVFPEGRYARDMRMYLSKGVCPPVARWIYTSLENHLKERPSVPGKYERAIRPGEVAGFRIRRRDYPRLDTNPQGLPELRAEEVNE